MTGIDVDSVQTELEQRIVREVRTISRVLHEQGHRSWIVGGCVRDAALAVVEPHRERKMGDWDLATTARPRDVQQLFKRVIPTGIQHGTVTIVLNGQHFEVTTLRGERGHSDGRRPDEVFFVDDLREDLLRRDFTVNAIAYDVVQRELSDPFDGLGDLRRRLIRAVGMAGRRFEEDGLRVLRGARFCATLGFDLEPATRRAIRPSLGSFRKVAFERVRDEWFKALSCVRVSPFLRVLHEEGLLECSAPELSQQEQAFERTAACLDAAPPDPILRLALWTQLAGASNLTGELAARFRLSKQETARWQLLVHFAELPPALRGAPSASAVRHYAASIGRAAIPDVLTVQRLLSRKAVKAHELLADVAHSDVPLTLQELAVQGGDLIRHGLPPGPAVGAALQQLLAAVLDDPSRNEREQLLALSRTLGERDSRRP